ncbi:PTS IIA-like nitrogen regulatory protein PtsN [Hydrocarboniclastica marina]|uniref:PTS IIA-like nitrogen-regulatory protein PtsN n=1 Tax=Hydrocarboniclastica marina TaxID=2259620 RepID=A0A4P7XJ38_9ALTE|nr:PTS IIA-like nitrogen regulatory protein PtsN [Hydrocarboniclastica marina]MAL97985.1 PTS IIA-like nitrogen-regulatory protein PtsN [Alteromonadaceae bacterium]QCF26574.1 PTS IIA-like nitrogen-regulatory protein PtsN [Hydrocarboniclastica marina]|tara:strand:- start:2392 stop:2856 length:465 start_codon:yes stop_codon:yes gene_type:complete
MTETAISIQSILAPELTLTGVVGSSKKRVLEVIASHIASQYAELNEDQIFNNLVARERLGSTGIGQGIAIPHCRLENCSRVVGALLALNEPIPFDAIDNEPVDLLFVLIVPQEATSEHLELLSQLAEKFNDRAFCQRLRDAANADELYSTIVAS